MLRPHWKGLSDPGSPTPGSQPRPDTISRYNNNDINSAISQYADPEFHCEMLFAEHPETHHEHAFVIVPGGMKVPVMSCRGSHALCR